MHDTSICYSVAVFNCEICEARKYEFYVRIDEINEYKVGTRMGLSTLIESVAVWRRFYLFPIFKVVTILKKLIRNKL